MGLCRKKTMKTSFDEDIAESLTSGGNLDFLDLVDIVSFDQALLKSDSIKCQSLHNHQAKTGQNRLTSSTGTVFLFLFGP
jgi:hypothetical protein